MAVGSLAASSCGYALAGRGNALPADITIIGVPYFVNQSSEPEIERVIGDAVRAEFQSKGKYRVQPDEAGVDGLLTGSCHVGCSFVRPPTHRSGCRPRLRSS